MLLATGHARYADLIERTLYNAILAGVSLSGERYFYVNPLASNGEVEHLHRGGPLRKPWHLVACCPPNVMRLLASLGHYVATRDGSGLQIHQYAAGRLQTSGIRLTIETAYPWEGRVRITVDETSATPWTLALRVPGWCTGAGVRVNGSPAADTVAPGYPRDWTGRGRGDGSSELDLPLEAHCVKPTRGFESDAGCVAVERARWCTAPRAGRPSGSSGTFLADLEIDTARR